MAAASQGRLRRKETPEAKALENLAALRCRRPAEADIIVALGGDGLMLQTLHRFIGTASRSTA